MTDGPKGTAARLEAALAARAEATVSAHHSGALRLRDRVDATGRSRPADLMVAPLPGSGRKRRVALTAVTGSILAVAATAAVVLVLDPGSSGEHGPGVRPAAGGPGTSTRTALSAPAIPSARVSAVSLSAAAGRSALESAAAARGQAQDPSVGPTQYLLQRTQQPVTDEPGVYTIDETWAPSGKTRDWVRVQRQSDATTDEFRYAGVCNDLYQKTQDPPTGKGCGRTGAFDDISPRFLAALPRSPADLYGVLRSNAVSARNPQKVHDTDYLTLMSADTLFTSDALPADLAGALVHSLAHIDSARVVQNVATCTGRTGLGVQVSATNGQGQDATHDTIGIIIDPDTGAYLGSYDGAPNSADYSASDVTTTVVNETPPAK